MALPQWRQWGMALPLIRAIGVHVDFYVATGLFLRVCGRPDTFKILLAFVGLVEANVMASSRVLLKRLSSILENSFRA